MNTRRSKKLRGLQAGVSLLEVLVTVLIVTGGLVVVMSSFVGIAKSGRYVEKMETANSLLRMEMEGLRNMSYSDIISETTDYGSAYTDQTDYRKETRVTDLGNVKRITIQIFFDDDQHSAEATTIITQL